MISLRRIEEMESEAAYHRDRHRLYLAKTHGSKLTSPARLHELERRHRSAEARLASALRENALERAGVVEEQE